MILWAQRVLRQTCHTLTAASRYDLVLPPQQAPCCIHFQMAIGCSLSRLPTIRHAAPCEHAKLESRIWPTAGMHVSVIVLDVHIPACFCSPGVAKPLPLGVQSWICRGGDLSHAHAGEQRHREGPAA